LSAEEAMGKANAQIRDLLKKGGYNMSE